MPSFLLDTFESIALDPAHVERLLKPLVDGRELDRSVLEHMKTPILGL